MKKALLILGPLVLILSIVGGLIAMGVIKLPGAKPPAAKVDPAAVATTPPVKKPTPAPTPKPTGPVLPGVDMKKGAETLADLWNQMDTPTLLAISKDWKDPELVVVLAKMDEDKVAEFLTAIAKTDAKHASTLSKLMQREAGTIPPDRS